MLHTDGAVIAASGKYCGPCGQTASSDHMKSIAPSGWAATQSARAQRLRAETQRAHGAAKKAWDPASHPAWLDEPTYRQTIQPRLLEITTSAITAALGVTWAYAHDVRKGKKIPHSRHWLKLAEIVGYAPGK